MLDRALPKSGLGRYALVLASVLLAPLALRLAAIVDRAAAPTVGDLHGSVSDVLVALLALLLLLVVGRFSRRLGVLLVAVWTIFHYVNYESVRVLGALASIHDIGFLGDTTFLLGSALAVSRPLVLGLLTAASMILASRGLRGGAGSSPVWSGVSMSAGAAVLLLGVHLLWPWTDEIAFWRQTNFVQQATCELFRTPLHSDERRPRFANPPEAMLDLVPELRADLGGEPIIAREGRAKNVLLVVIESLSGGHVASLAADHGYRTPHRLPALDALARANLSYSTFFAQQRKTNRGMYAILCGELPNLLVGVPKMTEYTSGGWRRCLPEVLGDAGYETVYMQAAPLAFMMKDQFMPRAGFDRVYGDAHLEKARYRTQWGMDDRSFFENGLDTIEALREASKPWFLTLLTAGTHHPFSVPHDFEADVTTPGSRALAYADMAAGYFFRELEARGILEDTLVLITSDESRGREMETPTGATGDSLAENWGILIVLLPERRSLRIPEPFAQVDLATSILDYLDLSELGTHFFGRSVFREYRRGRLLFFANTNRRTIGLLDPFRRLLVCRAGESLCNKYQMPQGRVFGASPKKIDWDDEEASLLQEMARRSVHSRRSSRERRRFDLVGDPRVPLAPFARKIIHGGQYLDLDAGQWLEVEVEIEVRGEGGPVQIDHYTTRTNTMSKERDPTARRRFFTKKIELAVGQTLRLHYAIAPETAVQGVHCRSYAKNVGQGPVELVFQTGRVTVRSAGERPETLVQVYTFELAPSDQAESVQAGVE
jgi:arylsulfatase A-like enzyme